MLSTKQKLKSLVYVTISGMAAFTGISIYKQDEKFHKRILMPVLHLIDPENTHRLAILISKYRLYPKSNFVDPPQLKVRLFGKEFPNPVGIAAGFDKDCEAILGLKDMGFGFVEVGSVTPEPQPGNQRPRVFRLPKDLAVINRYGFNSKGHDAVFQSLYQFRNNQDINDLRVGVNLGKNKTSPDPVNDYVEGVKKFGPLADYLVINVSSPNTPGLRSMQNKEILTDLLLKLKETRDQLQIENKPPLLLKLAPDLTDEERKDIAEVIRRPECKIDGLIISNTTIKRPNLQNSEICEAGGLSGLPLKDMSTKMIADMYRLTGGMPIIGVGGVWSGEDAYEKIRAGARVIQLYTALVYEGPPVVKKVKKELAELLKRDGFSSVEEAVGKDVKL